MAKVVWNANLFRFAGWHLRRGRTYAPCKRKTFENRVQRRWGTRRVLVHRPPDFESKGKAEKNEHEGGEHAETDNSQHVPTAASQVTTSTPSNPAMAASTASIAAPPSTTPQPGSTIPTPPVPMMPTITDSLNTLSIRLPKSAISRVQPPSLTAPTRAEKENQIDLSALVKRKAGTKKKLTIRVFPPAKGKPHHDQCRSCGGRRFG